jgi:hypothetical protein
VETPHARQEDAEAAADRIAANAPPRPPGFRRLRTKLTVYSLALFVLVLSAILAAVYVSVARNVERAVDADVAAAR